MLEASTRPLIDRRADAGVGFGADSPLRSAGRTGSSAPIPAARVTTRLGPGGPQADLDGSRARINNRAHLDRDGPVEIERDLPIVIVPHQALDPENRGEAHTARDWLHVVQADAG